MDTPVTSGFGKAAIAFVCPPLYFLLRRRFLAAGVHTIIYFLAFVLLIVGVGVFLWAMSAAHAFWDFAHVKQEQLIQRQATVMAERLAEKMSVSRAD